MNLIFDDNQLHIDLAPLTLTRPVSEIRMGILTNTESWKRQLAAFIPIEEIEYKTENYLYSKFRESQSFGVKIAANIFPTPELAKLVAGLEKEESLYVNGHWVATHGIAQLKKREVTIDDDQFIRITKPWHIFQQNGKAIQIDFDLITKGRTTQQLSSTNQVIGNGEIFIEEGAVVECCILNTSKGPIYIGKDAEIMEGSIVRGPFAMEEHAVVKMGAKLYGDSTIGPYCKVGGEIANSIFFGYSNKGHDGYMGNSVIGEWCNFGADTNTSNLKNNYSNVRFYSYETQAMEETDVQFCGVIMGDHSKTGINTMLNTATFVGVSANIFGAGFPNKYIPSFSWGGTKDYNDRFELEKVYEVAENMMGRRSVELTEGDKSILKYLFDHLA
ncbi:glucose-1-phosphate thymidylyltransferase [Paracrocinitomix mangrovi]|uniref:putative sugar nucleotidyl transferase n=1 Tax=Paracrocinitomix mangrovi TaxID=2862509 RepID=UPI001C8DA83E|nr:putative sugar nucleotidyl transferase [Paracrocinitomix mangrovi]UKN02953.1 glucose-1-phosphate thymidylyltransferase [Paracrocinitomix mangrovi]